MKRDLPPKVKAALEHLDQGVEMLRNAANKYAPDLQFTLDGRLIGDIGELMAVEHFGISPQQRQKTGYDGTDPENRQVEIKTTRLSAIAFRKIAERVICIKIHGTSHWEVIFDGPGSRIAKEFPKAAFKKGNQTVQRNIPASLKSQRQLSITRLAALSH
jgi:hypothetical protein